MAELHVEGLAEVNRKLAELQRKTGRKVLRSALVNATTPAVRQMKMAVPVGTVAHRTYEGRLVSPGFLKRSIRRVSSKTKTGASVRIGVRREAFYGVEFIESGKDLRHRAAAHPWFKVSFEAKAPEMTRRFASQLRSKIEEAAR